METDQTQFLAPHLCHFEERLGSFQETSNSAPLGGTLKQVIRNMCPAEYTLVLEWQNMEVVEGWNNGEVAWACRLIQSLGLVFPIGCLHHGASQERLDEALALLSRSQDNQEALSRLSFGKPEQLPFGTYLHAIFCLKYFSNWLIRPPEELRTFQTNLSIS